MKNTKAILAVVASVVSIHANADIEGKTNLTEAQKIEVARAILVLQNVGALKSKSNDVQIDRSILEDLEGSGLLEVKDSAMGTICTGGGGL